MSGEESSSMVYNAIISIAIGIGVAGGLVGIAKISSRLKKNKMQKK